MKKLMSVLLVISLIFCTLAVSSVSIGADDVLFGDVNSDGEVNVKDALNLVKYLAKVEGVTINVENSNVKYDFNTAGEPVINSMDRQYLRKYLAKILDTLVPEGYTTIPHYDVANTYTMSDLSDSMMIYGRAEVDGDTVKIDQTAGGIKFKANCEGNLQFNVTTNNGGYMDVMVDDNFNNIHRVTLDSGSSTATYFQELNLASGDHTFTLLKATEWQRNSFTLNSVTINGVKSGTQPRAKNIKLEFYGDSITSGYGNLSDGGTSKWNWMYQDGCQTYASYCAYHLNADYAVAAAGGYGVLGGYDNTTNTYDKFFDYSNVSLKTAWDRKAYGADAVIINLGTNDVSRDGDNLDTAEFKAKCKSIIETIHTDNPTAKILWIIGMNYVSDNAKVVLVLKELADEYKAESTKNKTVNYFFFTKFTNRQNGGDSHPSLADHKIAGEELANYLVANDIVEVYSKPY